MLPQLQSRLRARRGCGPQQPAGTARSKACDQNARSAGEQFEYTYMRHAHIRSRWTGCSRRLTELQKVETGHESTHSPVRYVMSGMHRESSDRTCRRIAAGMKRREATTLRHKAGTGQITCGHAGDGGWQQ